MQAAGWLKQVIDADKPARAFVDVGGVGAAFQGGKSSDSKVPAY